MEFMNERYPTVELFQELSRISTYPDGVVPVPSQIPGLAFFPGGHGVYQEEGLFELPAFPFRKVMVVGQDFDTLKNFEKSSKRHEENRNVGAWGNLLPLLDRSGIPRAGCFFTNAYMGLRATGRNVGPSVGSRSEAFRATCLSFFLRQLELQEPRLILCLGAQVARFLAHCSSDLQAWSGGSFASIDSTNSGVLFNVGFGDRQPVPAVVALVHPSFRSANIGRRRYRNDRGEAAEQALLIEAIARSGGIDVGSPSLRPTELLISEAPRLTPVALGGR
jgi:uracil-DNA glycosylase